jgi:hypothetical protein
MDYRIIVETEKSGKKRYYIQNRVVWKFWAYLRVKRDIYMNGYRVVFDELKDAEQEIRARLSYDHLISQAKVVSREVIQIK